jgi:putative ABC transport system ATP-binding protein
MIEVKNVTKSYELNTNQAVLNEISFTVSSGQFTAIMGPSGSGKSTLLNLIAGLDRPTSGHVMVGEINVSTLSEAASARYRRQQIGFIYQFFNLLQQLTVLNNVILPAQLAGISTQVARSRAMELLDQLGIVDKAQEYPARISGGQRQRVAIARALINHPAVLLADEPTGALDSRSGDQVMDVLAEINRTGQTVVMVTHDARLAANYAERIIKLRDGRIANDTVMQSPSIDRPSILLHMYDEEAE